MLKRIWKILRNTLIVIILLVLALYFAIRIPTVQTWITQGAASYLSNQLGTRVEVGGVEIDLWARLVVKELYVEDQHQDTLAYISQIALRNYKIDKVTGDFKISNAEIDGLYFNLVRYDGEKTLSYKFILDYIDSFKSDTTASKPTNLYLNNIVVTNSRFNYINQNRAPIDYYGIDWNHLQTNNIQLEVNEFSLVGDSITGDVRKLAMQEKSGFVLDNLAAQLKMVNGDVLLTNTSLKTPGTDLKGKLNFLFTSMDDLDDFSNRVEMNHELDSSNVQMSDLAYFADFFEGYSKSVNISGKFRGKVANLKGRNVNITIDENTRFVGNFDMEGLPEIDQTFISMDIKELTSNKIELERIQLPPYDSIHYLKVPDNFAQLGQITYKGNFTGFINDFVSYGKINTAIGSINTDLSLKEDEKLGDYTYTGKLGTTNFDLGKFYNSSSLGPLSCDLEVKGSGTTIQTVNAEFEGAIPNIYLNGYNYTNINADGVFRLREFSGEFTVDDPNLDMDFVGAINFKPKDPILDFEAWINHANLKAMNVLKAYDYHSVSGKIKARSEGFELEKFVGEIILDDITYCSGNNEYEIKHLELTSTRAGEPTISIDSDIAEATIRGDFDLAEIVPSLTEIVAKLYPGFEPITHEHHTQNFTLDVKLFDVKQITEVFLPKLKIAQFTNLSLVMNEADGYFELTLLSDSVQYGNDRANGIVMDIQRPDESFYITATSDMISTSFGLDFDDFALDARTEKDTVFTSFAWGLETSPHKGDVNSKVVVRDYDSYTIVFNHSSISAKNQQWNFLPNSTAIIDSSEIQIRNFELYSGNQIIHADGEISKDPTKWLNLTIKEFDVASINAFMTGDTKFYGVLNGQAAVRDLYNNLIFTNDISLQHFQLNDYKVGDLKLTSTWDNALSRLRIDGTVEKIDMLADKVEQYIPLSFAGYYSPKNEKSPLDITATIKDLDLGFINTFMTPGVMKFEGFASGTMAVTGKPEAPQLNSDASLRDASVYINYLNTKYYLGNKIGVYPDMFTFDNVVVTDQENNKGNLVGQIIHDNFSSWNFDLFIEMEKEPMLVMNTDENMNSMYYGKAYTTGTVNISGYDSNLNFDCYLKTEKGTTLAMPMGVTGEETFENFVRFVNTGDTIQDVEMNLSGITLSMDIEVTPDAEFKIIFDESVGDIMSGRAQGNISLRIDNLATFNMYGSLEVTKGDYLFTLKNLINKKFAIRPGGTINWYGDPLAGELNMSAIYKVNASISDIVQEPEFQSGQRVPVELEMKLRGRMLNPAIEFDIVLPSVDQMTRSRVNAAISSEQEKNRQAFALLALNKFITPPNVTANHGIDLGVAANTSELLSNQISNWLSQISDDFNLGFKYSPGNDISNEEIALALSTQLFNEKLSLSTNVGVSRNTTTSASGTTNLIGDIRIEYKLTPEGKIRLVVYNESNDYRMAAVQQSPYTQGVGIIYRTEFDTMEEFFQGFKRLIKGKKSDS